MPHFTTADGLSIAYDDTGPSSARPLLMAHGFSSNRNEGWKRTGWFAACERRGQRAVALDLRGHGESDKPHDPAMYGAGRLAGDVLALMDHLDIGTADLVGFSLGARVAAGAALAQPGRFSNLVLAGVGDRWLNPLPEDDRMAVAMEAADPDTIDDLLVRSFRDFADEQGEDRLALAACSRARREPITADDLWGLTMPTLVVAGVARRAGRRPPGAGRSHPRGRGR